MANPYKNLAQISIYYTITIIIIALGLVYSMFVQLLINTLIVGSGYGLIAMAFRLMYSVSPFFNLTLGSVAAIGAYATFHLISNVGFSPAYAIILALSVSALFAWALEYFAYKPMRANGASPMILLVASLGFYTIFEALIHLVFGPQYQTLGNISFSSQIDVWFAEVPLVQVLTILCNAFVFIGLDYFLNHTFMGKQIRALNDSPTLSNMIGMNNDKIIIIVSILAGLILGLAGILVGYDTGMEPTMGFNLLFKGMIGAIIGGMANLKGAFLGAFFLAFAENIGVWAFASEWRDMVAFVIFTGFLYFRPKGIFQKKKGIN